MIRWESLKAKPWPYYAKCSLNGGFKLISLACALHLVTEYIGNISFMSGPSMLPTFSTSGELVIEDIISHRLYPDNISRGDLVTLRSPVSHSRIICKRVIGLPGDIVCVDPTGLKWPSTMHTLVPKGHVWVSGDNAEMSIDSRDYGPVSMALIRGKPFARIWPLKELKIFRNPITFLD